ncbi:MAG: acyltransferase [Armatimonadetes bacterium]|nr:acyltransferase [Armatimonadota bacterium]
MILPDQNTVDSTSGTNTNASKSAVSRFDSIDGLRAIACIIVILHHCFYHTGKHLFPSVTVGSHLISLPLFFSYGYTGVDLFFALSAFCLSYPLLKLSAKPFEWKVYLSRRAQRILPPYYIAWAIFLVSAIIIAKLRWEPLLSDGVLQSSRRDIFLSFFLITTAMNPSFWTLCLEARWYFVLPVLLNVLKRVGSVATILVSIVISAAFFYLGSDVAPSNIWVGRILNLSTPLPFFLPTFVLGVIAAQLLIQREDWLRQSSVVAGLRLGWVLSFAGMILTVEAIPTSPTNWSRLLFASLLSFFAILLALVDDTVRKHLSRSFLVTIGVASYSIYLIHEPLIRISYAYIKTLEWSPMLLFLWCQGVMPVLLVGIGYGFFCVAERPFLLKRSAPKQNSIAVPAERGIS